MKQNKKYVAIFSVVIMLSAIVSLSSYAYTDSSTNGIDFTEQPIPVVSTISQSELVNNGLYVGKNTNWNDSPCYVASTVSDVYCFFYKVNASQVVPYFVRSETFSSSEAKYTMDASGENPVQNLSVTYNSDYSLYYCNTSSGKICNDATVPVFDSVDSGLSAVRDWIDNPPVVTPSTGAFTAQIQPGYAMYIDVTNLNVTANLSQTTPVSYWGLGATQFIDTTNSIPNPITNANYDSIIQWTGTGRADSFGKYSNWVSTVSVNGIASDHNHVYLGIINPLQNDSASTSGMDVSSVANGIINVSVSNSNSVKIYPLETTFNAGIYNSQSGDVSATGSSDGNGGLTYTNDATGEPYNQEFGGLTTPANTATTINDWLESIANNIGGFFRGAIGAVSTLVSAGSAFITQLIGLYSWLPAPVYSVLSSALILVITIGVIKVFV